MATVLPVAPDSDVPQILVVSAVLQVFGANDAVPPAGIDDVAERDGAGLALLAQPGGRDGSVVGVATFELDLSDFGLLEDGGTLRLSMAKHNLVSLGADLEKQHELFGSRVSDEEKSYSVPGDILGVNGDEIGVTLTLLAVQFEASSDLFRKSKSFSPAIQSYGLVPYLGGESDSVELFLAVNETQEVPDGGELRLSDVVPREFFGLDNNDRNTFPGKCCSCIRSTGAASDNEDSGRFGLV